MNARQLLLFLIWSSVAVNVIGPALKSQDCERELLGPGCENNSSDSSAKEEDSSGDKDDEQNNQIADQGKSNNKNNGNNNDTNKAMDANKKGSGSCKDEDSNQGHEDDKQGSKPKFFQKDYSEVLPELTNKTKLLNQIGIAITACLSLPMIWMSRNIALFYKDKAKTQVRFYNLSWSWYQRSGIPI